MKGFLSVTSTRFPRKKSKRIFHFTNINQMLKAGFTIDNENNVFVREGYGALVYNVDSSIQSIKDLICHKGILDTYTYDGILDNIIEGYQYVIGPGAPSSNGIVYGNGLYCTNYKEIAERQKDKDKVKTL